MQRRSLQLSHFSLQEVFSGHAQKPEVGGKWLFTRARCHSEQNKFCRREQWMDAGWAGTSHYRPASKLCITRQLIGLCFPLNLTVSGC